MSISLHTLYVLNMICQSNRSTDGVMSEASMMSRPVDGEHGRLLGYLLYYWSYSTWTGRTLYVEDVYVTQDHRRKGMASAMWKRAIEIAVTSGCQRMQWSVLEWNSPAISFYKKMGALDMHEKEGWIGFRLTAEDLKPAVTSLA